MATKKQKRLAGEKKQAANREANRLSGLRAQARDRERREHREHREHREAKKNAGARRAGVQEAVAKMVPLLPVN